MNDFATAVAEDNQNEQNVEGGCRNREKINRTLVRMIFQESSPGLRRLRIRQASGHQVGNNSLGNLETQPEQFPMNPGCTPVRVGLSHFPDKITDITIGFWSSGSSRFEFPEKLKALAVPTHNSIRPYYDKRFAPRNPNSGEHNPEEPIRHSNFRPLVCPFHHGQLMTERKVLSGKIRDDFGL